MLVCVFVHASSLPCHACVYVRGRRVCEMSQCASLCLRMIPCAPSLRCACTHVLSSLGDFDL